jgi:hypothetical protein
VVSCCLSATGVRFSGHPHPARELCLPHGRPTAAEHGGGPVGVSTFHTHEIRPGWVPSLPRGRRCSSWTGCRARPAPAASQRLSLHSVTTSHHGATIHEASTKVHAIHPSGLPLTRDPRMGQGSFGFPLGLRTLPLPATHAKGGARHRARARDYTTDITSALLTASPLAKCDIVSQRQNNALDLADCHRDRCGCGQVAWRPPRARRQTVCGLHAELESGWLIRYGAN